MIRAGRRMPEAAQVSLRSLTPSVFLPVITYEVGNGTVGPVIALTALHLGAPVGVAGLVAALPGIGQLAGNVPAAWLTERLGERRSMTVAAAAGVVCFLASAQVHLVGVLAIAMIGAGACNCVYYLARQSYLTARVPLSQRGRAMSVLGGSHRAGQLIGPFAGAGAISLLGISGAYLVAAAAAACAVLILLVVRRPPGHVDHDQQDVPVRPTISLRAVLSSHRRVLATLGLTVLAVRAVQAANKTLIPLWGHHLRLSAATTSQIFGIAGIVELLLSYPAGKVIDRFGRQATALPSAGLMALAALTMPLGSTVTAVVMTAMLTSAGQGIGAGLVLTLAADAAPEADSGRNRFLALWRLFSDSGSAIGPVVVALVASVAPLGVAAVAIGGVGLAACYGYLRWVPGSMTATHSTRSTNLQNGRRTRR